MPSSNSARYHDRALSDLGEAAYAAVTCFLICLRVHTDLSSAWLRSSDHFQVVVVFIKLPMMLNAPSGVAVVRQTSRVVCW